VTDNSATVNWRTEQGTEYYILVGSRDGTDGSFELQIREFSPRANDDCDKAETIALGDGVISSTVLGTPDFTYGQTCGAPLDTSGLWYRVEGTGNGIEVSTCYDNDYNSAISVFTGSACDDGNRTCLTGSAVRDPLCDYHGVTAAWLSEEGESYYVYVHGAPLNSMGSFTIVTMEFNVTEPNEFCQQSIFVIPDGTRIEGSTKDAVHGSGIAECGVEMTNPGLWYSFEGTGNPIEVTACKSGENENFDVSTSIFTGDNCGEANCVNGASFSGQQCLPEGESSGRRFLQTDAKQKLVIDSEAGELYYVYVHGQNPDNLDGGGFGDYELYIKEVLPETPAPTEDSSSNFDDDKEESGASTNANGGNGKNNNALYSLLILLLLIPLVWYFRKQIFACCSRRGQKDRTEKSDLISKDEIGDDWDPSPPHSQEDSAEDESGDEDGGNDQSSRHSMNSDGYEDEQGDDSQTNLAQGDSDDEEYDNSRGRR
jgi:hypothetical protein